MGGTHSCAAVVDLDTGEIAGSPCEAPLDSKAGADEIVSALSDNIVRAVKSSGVESVEGAGLAFPGPFDYVHGVSVVQGVGKYERIYGLDVATSLFSRLKGLGIGEFRFVNDASAFALGECASGAAKGRSRVVAITLGTGVGSGFVSDGRLVESGDEVPAFGWVYHLPFEGGIVDEAFSTRWICGRYASVTGIEVTGAKEVADRCAAGEEAAVRLFKEYGERFAEFVVPVLDRFKADMLVLGGNIARAYGYFGEELEKGMAARGCRTEVGISALWGDAAMIGAASLFV